MDLSGLNCPLPILKTKKFLATRSSGDVITVITTDPASFLDLQEFCQKTGHELLAQSNSAGIISSIIRHR